MVKDLTPHLPKMADSTARHYHGATTSRVWTPIDNYNQSWYEGLLQRGKTAAAATVDFDKENKVCPHSACCARRLLTR